MSIKLTGESMQKKDSNYEFGFFKLENNHDKAEVRFCHENYEDFSRRPVHFVKVPGQKYRVSVNCLRDDNAPDSVCPFCSSNVDTSIVSKRSKRIYIEFLVYRIMDKNNKVLQDYSDNPKRMVWEKERRFDDKIFSLSSRYNPLCDTVFMVERFGEKGSTETTYDIYPIVGSLEQYPLNMPEKLYDPDGIQVEDRTADEMNYYLENEFSFPPKDDGEQVTRRSDVAQKNEFTPIPDMPEQNTTVQQTYQQVQNSIPQTQQTFNTGTPIVPAPVAVSSEPPVQQQAPTSRRRSI